MAWQRLFAQPVRGSARPWQAPPEVFALGVASGEPRPDSVVIWTRLAPRPLEADGGMPEGPVSVRWQVSLTPDFARLVTEGEVLTDAARAHSVHVEVRGLQPGTRHHYRFLCGGQTSPTGRTRTAPAIGAEVDRLRMAVASCQHYEMGFYALHRHLSVQDLDLVMFLGDYLYEGHAPGSLRLRTHARTTRGVMWLPDYRRHYGQYKLDPDLQACHAAHPWLVIPDDHEVRNDFDGLHDPNGLTEAQMHDVRSWAYQAWFEHLPVSPTRAPVGPDAHLHARYPWGRLADLWLLDVRQHKSAPPCEGSLHSVWRDRLLWRCDEASAASRTMLGMTQEAWLAQGLKASAAPWKLVGQGTQIAPGRLSLAGESLTYADGWDAFPAARDRLMDAVVGGGPGRTVFFSGDVHRHVAAQLRQRPDDARSPVVATEFVTSSLTSRGLSDLLSDRMRQTNPDLLHLRSDQRGCLLVTLRPERMVVQMLATPHPVRAGAVPGVQATFEVLASDPKPRRRQAGSSA